MYYREEEDGKRGNREKSGWGKAGERRREEEKEGEEERGGKEGKEGDAAEERDNTITLTS